LGKGVIRYRRPDQMNMRVVRSMLAATSASKAKSVGLHDIAGSLTIVTVGT
jgi:hypothetical protein